MVSKRQKEAKKRFNDANPQLFSDPKPEHSSTSTSKKKKEKKKKGEAAFKKGKKTGGAATRKHPLRVPGMRPGESCFICKATDHIAKLCPEKAMWEKKKICLLCRQHGHSLKNCPEKSDDTNKKKLCYNCGEVGHSLSRCSLPLKDGGTKFASCFICKELGHLSKNCPNSTHGVYPKGGSCRICGEVTHLAKHCPNKGNKSLDTSTGQQKFCECGLGNGGARRVQAQVLGPEGEEELPVHRLQDRREDTAGDGGEAGPTRRDLRRLHRLLAGRRMPLCRLRLRLRHRRALPEEQDLLHILGT
ncbi:uncharacterized protein LOC135609082 isoform X1 [Musa acuminata AAA Group]|uniref:uncharacterized protein LOC135584228 isoform X1 n=1 Tax=Musa acuminata AAA Group TaxID=214697 RepID=UPI0031D6999A